MALARKKRRPNLSARERILEAATKLFTERPFSEISADDIAREAGVAHGLTFHHFGSKAALYQRISQAAADRLDQIHIQATLTGSPAERLRSFLVAHMDEVYRRRVDFVFHSRGGGTAAIQQIWERSRSNAIRLIMGFYDVVEPSPQLAVAARAWLGYYDELVLAWVQGQIDTKATVVEMAFRLFPLAIANAKLLGATNIPSI
jgi:AcrR family transcriptional regulator